MSNLPFKDLRDVLKRSSGLAPIQHAWQENAELAQALSSVLSEPLFRQVIQLRRSDPEKGIRGSELTVIARNTASATKIRLVLADWVAELSARGWGIQSVKVVAQRQTGSDPVTRSLAPRSPIPAGVKQQLLALSENLSSERLRSALKKISR